MLASSVCGDGAEDRRGAGRGVQIIKPRAWRCAPASAPPRLRAYLPHRGGNSSDLPGCRYALSNMRARCAIESHGVEKKKFSDFRTVVGAAINKRSLVD